MINELKNKYKLDTEEILANLILDYPGHSVYWLSRVSGYSEATIYRIMYKFMVWGIVSIRDVGQGCYHDYRWSHALSKIERMYTGINWAGFITYQSDEPFNSIFARTP